MHPARSSMRSSVEELASVRTSSYSQIKACQKQVTSPENFHEEQTKFWAYGAAVSSLHKGCHGCPEQCAHPFIVLQTPLYIQHTNADRATMFSPFHKFQHCLMPKWHSKIADLGTSSAQVHCSLADACDPHLLSAANQSVPAQRLASPAHSGSHVGRQTDLAG